MKKYPDKISEKKKDFKVIKHTVIKHTKYSIDSFNVMMYASEFKIKNNTDDLIVPDLNRNCCLFQKLYLEM